MGVAKSSGSQPPTGLLAERSATLLQSQSVASVSSQENVGQEPPIKGNSQAKIMPEQANDQFQPVENDFFTVALGESGSSIFRVPDSPVFENTERWVPVGEAIEIAGELFESGMVYVGNRRADYVESLDPSLINLKLKVARGAVNISMHLKGSKQNYRYISIDARRAYLQWLSSGRKDPEANIGCVFLFFYGLERRALVDAMDDSSAEADIPEIVFEVERLISIYGGNIYFKRHACNFLEFLGANRARNNLYLSDPPVAKPYIDGMPIELRIGLGQLAAKRLQTPANWALSWVLADHNICKRTPVFRCHDLFANLFKTQYEQIYGEGIILPQCKAKLVVDYMPASSALALNKLTSLKDIPDVAVMMNPRKKLQAIVDQCSAELEHYSRYLGHHPDNPDSLEGVWQLPMRFWPEHARKKLDKLKRRIGDGVLAMRFGELFDEMKVSPPITRGKAVGLARALDSLCIGIEVDVLGDSRIPKAEEAIILFSIEPEDGTLRISSLYGTAEAMLDLACTIATTDDGASPRKLILLSGYIDSLKNISVAHRKRLKAHLCLQLGWGVTLQCMKKHLKALTIEEERALAKFFAKLACADGYVKPETVKSLERVYKILNLDTQRLYSDLHLAASGALSDMPVYSQQLQSTARPYTKSSASDDQARQKVVGKLSLRDGSRMAFSAVPPRAGTFYPKPLASPTTENRFVLDSERIAQLQRETEQVSALLAQVFVDDSAEEPETENVTPSAGAVGICGLDTDHSIFLKLLVSRSEWNREDLEAVAGDMDLMLDGALELINDMAFEHFDMPVTEGEDPFEINPDIMDKLPL